MKKNFITKKLFLINLLLILFYSTPEAQNNFSIGGYFGGGIIAGFASGQESYTSSVFMEFNLPFMEDVNTRINFFYARDFNSLLGERRNYFPFIKGFSLKGIITQKLSQRVYLEEGAGIITIDDRTFSDVNEWNYGFVFSLLAGIDFRKNFTNGFRTGVGIEYGFTVSNTFAKYFSLHLQTQYVF